MQVRNLELLKLRFGESNLHFCEVMVKDIADSKRINTYVHTKLAQEKAAVRIIIVRILYSLLRWNGACNNTKIQLKLPSVISRVYNYVYACDDFMY